MCTEASNRLTLIQSAAGSIDERCVISSGNSVPPVLLMTGRSQMRGVYILVAASNDSRMVGIML